MINGSKYEFSSWGTDILQSYVEKGFIPNDRVERAKEELRQRGRGYSIRKWKDKDLVFPVISSKLPPLKIGFILVGVLTIAVLLYLHNEKEEWAFDLFLYSNATAGLYWYYCVGVLHSQLAKGTKNIYPVTTFQAIVGHFIPLFYYLWVFGWTSTLLEIADSAQNPERNNTVRKLGTMTPGFMLLLSYFTTGLLAPIGYALAFIAIGTLYDAIKAVEGKTVTVYGEMVVEEVKPSKPSQLESRMIYG